MVSCPFLCMTMCECVRLDLVLSCGRLGSSSTCIRLSFASSALPSGCFVFLASAWRSRSLGFVLMAPLESSAGTAESRTAEVPPEMPPPVRRVRHPHASLDCACCGHVRVYPKRHKLCKGCKMVRYCSVECQTMHWQEQHRMQCSREFWEETRFGRLYLGEGDQGEQHED